jgi:hypothetical protein
MKISHTSTRQLTLQETSADIFTIYYIPFGLCAIPALIFLKNGHLGFFVLFMVGLPVVILLIVSSIALKTELSLDRQRNIVEIHEGQLFPKVIFQRPLSDLVQAIVQEDHPKRSDGSPAPTTYRPAMEIVSSLRHEEVPVRDVFGKQRDAQELADTINTWLAQDVDSPTPQA